MELTGTHLKNACLVVLFFRKPTEAQPFLQVKTLDILYRHHSEANICPHKRISGPYLVRKFYSLILDEYRLIPLNNGSELVAAVEVEVEVEVVKLCLPKLQKVSAFFTLNIFYLLNFLNPGKIK